MVSQIPAVLALILFIDAGFSSGFIYANGSGATTLEMGWESLLLAMIGVGIDWFCEIQNWTLALSVSAANAIFIYSQISLLLFQ